MKDHYVLGAWGGPQHGFADFVEDETCADHWADAGLNVAIPPYMGPEPDQIKRMKRIFDAAAERNVRLILGLGGLFVGDLVARGETEFRRAIAEALRHFGDHPALYGFYIGDEPVEAGLADACRAMRIHNEMAPHLHNFLNHRPAFSLRGPDGSFTDLNRMMDRWVQQGTPQFLCYDCYEPFNDMKSEKEGLDLYFESLRVYGEAAQRNNVPFWNSGLSLAFGTYRTMTEDDFRWQLNTTLAHGAAGLMYFYFFLNTSMESSRHAPVWFGERTEHFTYMRRVHDGFRYHTEPVVRHLRLRKVSHYGQAYGGVQPFDGRGLVLKAWADTPLIIAEFRHTNGADYVMVVNNSRRRSSQARIWVRGAKTNLYEWHRVNNAATERNVMNMHYECWVPDRGVENGEPFIAVSPNAMAPGQMLLYRVATGGT